MMHTLNEMARIGNTADNIEIHIYGKEGNIPHFHFFDKKTNRKGCIRLDCPEYFQHGKRYKDKLNKKEISNLIDFLKTQHKRFINVDFKFTNFDYMIMLWNDNNPDYQIEVDNMPDYNNL